MIEKFSFPSAKEALALSQMEALTPLQKKVEKKRKWTLLDTSMVDEHPAAKLSAAGAYAKLFLAKSSRRAGS